MNDDPFGLRRFGIYSEQDVALSAAVFSGEHTPKPRPPSLDAFLAYWTPEQVGRRVSEELSA